MAKFKYGSASRDRDEGAEFDKKQEALHHVENMKESGGMSMASMHKNEMKKSAAHTGRSVKEHSDALDCDM